MEEDRELSKQHSRLFWSKVLAAQGDEEQVEAMRPLLDFLPEAYFAAYLASEARRADEPRVLELARLASRLFASDRPGGDPARG